MHIERKELEEYAIKQMPLEYEQKLILFGIIQGIQIANDIKTIKDISISQEVRFTDK